MRLLISVFILALRRIVVKYRILFQLLTDALLQFLNRQLDELDGLDLKRGELLYLF